MLYCTGEEVRQGDIIREHAGFPLAEVTAVYPPGTPSASDNDCPEGGIYLAHGTLLVAYNGPGWSDIIFVRRRDNQTGPSSA